MRSGLNTGANSGARTGDAEARKKLRRFTEPSSRTLLDEEKQRLVLRGVYQAMSGSELEN
jgi:hypothetical protein